ncbi:hypothetical protein [Vibrio sp. D431a]|uniref:hypothetical protein n=1 Tax=Vibrio sp. D431a TaxID=2837388 RepID=UPI002556F171|nr:hypothetical protein [Vibrio sp. D431a]MDK9793277.1 hypothetical protein [Vibrio sp. D431a]
MSLEVCTPNFNDYNEFRFRNLRLSKSKFEPNKQGVELTPYDIEPFEIDKDELNYLDKWFCTTEGEQGNCADEQNSPYHYLDSDLLLTSCNFDTGYRHAVYRKDDWLEELEYFETHDDTWKIASEIPKLKLNEEGGLYCLLTHISEAVFANYYAR